MHRGLEAAGNAAVDLRELPLRPVGRPHRGQVVVDPVVDPFIDLLPRPGRGLVGGAAPAIAVQRPVGAPDSRRIKPACSK